MERKIIDLMDEDGEKVVLELIDVIEYEEKSYAVFTTVETDEEDDGEVFILEIETMPGEEMDNYVAIESEEILSAVYDIFEEKFKDEFNFVD